MAVASLSDISAAISSGKEHFVAWAKTFATGLSGANSRWYDLSGYSGTPAANPWSGSALACQNVNSLSTFSLWRSNVSPSTQHLLSMSAITSTSGIVPGMLMLVDMQCYWPGIALSSIFTNNFTGTPTLRYANGEGCRLYLVLTSASGGVTSNMNVSYTNQAGTTGRTLPSTVACNNSIGAGTIVHAGANANNTPSPFLPLASGDRGVQAVATLDIASSGGTGTAALVLARPLAALPLTLASTGCITDYLVMTPGLPVIKDDACLTLLYTTASSPTSAYITGTAGFVWG